MVVMRWFTALAVLVALAVTPALSLVCDTRCLDAAHAPGLTSSDPHAHTHSHVGHHRETAGRADVTTVSASPSGTPRCASHVEQAVPAAPRQWIGACAPLGAESVAPILQQARITVSVASDVRAPVAPPRRTLPLRI
jgi:hypothetical protein